MQYEQTINRIKLLYDLQDWFHRMYWERGEWKVSLTSPDKEWFASIIITKLRSPVLNILPRDQQRKALQDHNEAQAKQFITDVKHLCQLVREHENSNK